MSTELCFTPAIELAAMIRAKTVSPVEVTEAVLGRIAACEPVLNAFAFLAANRARAAAARAETQVISGLALGPLHGVPVTLKDLSWTRDMPTQFGSLTRRGYVPPADTPLVTRLEAAGAVVLGKTTTSEFGWTGVSRSPLTGITHNPLEARF